MIGTYPNLYPNIPNPERLFPKLSQVYTNICAMSRGARTFVLKFE